jgi:hypothetical protein
MTLVPVRALLLLTALLIAIGFVSGHLHWNSQRPSCFNGNRWYGQWVVIYSVGKLEFRQHPYGCPKSDQYDPKQFKSTLSVPVQ